MLRRPRIRPEGLYIYYIMDRNTLYRFFEGVSTSEEERRIVEWVDKDPVNEKTFNAERNIYNTMLMMEGAEIEEQSIIRSPKMHRMPRWAKELMRTAAAVILTAGVGYYFYAGLERRFDVADNSISVPTGQQLDLTLPDGTAVTVNGATTITYPAVFAKNERRIRLSGEAYFEVTHDKKHPFIIETSNYDVEVLGTEFNVEAYENSGEFVTSLVDGKVRVSGNGDSGESVTLSPNQQARLANGRLVVERIPEYEKFLWRDGLIAFNRAALPEIMELFEKYYGFRIVYNVDALPAVTFSGKIRISEGVDHAMWALQQNASFKYEKDTENMIITIK